MDFILEESFLDGRIVVLTFNRPEVMNAFNTSLGLELQETMERLSYDKTTQVIIVIGAGSKAFSTGGDFKERTGMTDEEWKQQHRLFENIARQFRQCPKPVIAAVNGYALGGGCEIALSCDFIIASKNALFGFPEVTRGIIPGIGGTQTISRFVPKGIALEMLLTGRKMDIFEAYERGIVNHVTEEKELLAKALQVAGDIAKNSPNAVKMAKRAYRLGNDQALEEGIEIALECYNHTVSHPDRDEGSRAFLEKRVPVYKTY